ncbi:hypothetical protein BGZ92_006241 [Podila epicladia]|nr:hypothetical protein BGZ92_006241 [Podila epicladia]
MSNQNAPGDLPYHENETEYDEFDEHDEVVKPRAAPFYKRRRFWIFCVIITVILVAILVPIILLVILPKVAQSIVNKSTLQFNEIAITEPTNTTMVMSMQGTLGDAGPFHATVSYPEPIKVFYDGTLLGAMDPLPETKASGGSGTITGSSKFTISNEAAFAEFSKKMDIKLLGMNGFPQVEILKFDLPSDAANGQGINLSIDTAMHNPSPIGVELGTVVLDISYQNVRLGQVRAAGASLKGQSLSVLNLTGIMEPQSTPEGLAKVSELFSAYIAGKASQTTAKGVAVLPDGNNRVNWLSAGLEAMVLNVKLQSPVPLNIIKSIALGPMGMNFTGTSDYAPIATSPQVVAGFQMPFGFSLNVTSVQNNMTVIYNEKPMAQVNALAWGAATTVKENGNSSILFALPPTPFAINDDAHADFDSFVKELTVNTAQSFVIQGTAGTIAQTPIGQVTITGIPFKSEVSLDGLQGLATQPTVIHSLTVIGGIPAGIQIALDLSMVNPSQLTLATGPDDRGIVSFEMQYQGDNAGTVIMTDLTLVPGTNRRAAGALFTPTGTAGGQALLQKYMTNQVATVDIFGSAASSAIAPLANGLKEIHIQSEMPGNPAQLVLGASLSILNDTAKTGIALTSVTVNNPFIPQLTIKAIQSSVKYHDAVLGSIDIPDMTFVVPGNSAAASAPLPLTMNLSIESLLGLIITQAQTNGMNPAPIMALGQMAKDPTYKPDPALFVGFNLPVFVKAAMVGLKVDIDMSVNVLLGVPTSTDDSILMLLPIVGTPLAQSIVDQAILSFDSLMINSPAETSFTTAINGMIANTGPFDAQIAFPMGSTVSWVNGENVIPIGQIAMPTVPAKANVGAPLVLSNVSFAVANAEAMGQFVGYSLKAESFEWEITANEMVIFAMGAPIPHVNMKKRVTLKGFNGLSGLTINAFNLPSNDPDGIHLVLAATLPNPSSVGIELGTVAFTNVYNGQEIGYVSTVGMSLLPNSVSPINMAGTLTRQTSQEGLAALGDLFRVTLAGGTPSLIVKGKSVTPPSGPVSWLSQAFGSLTMNVSLPSIGKQNIITGVSLKTMTLDFTVENPFNPMTSSDNIEASYHMPFTFPLNVTAVAQTMNLQLVPGQTIAVLSMPMSPASTIADGVLRTGYTNQPLKVTDEGHDIFMGFNKVLTTGPGVQFLLDGMIDTVAETAAGAITIPGISAQVTTAMAGMNLNAGPATISNIRITGGTAEYIEVSNIVTLQNPSGLTVKAGDVALDVYFHGAPMGKAIVSNMVLVPGVNNLPAIMRMVPPPALRDQFLSAYLMGATFPLDIQGSATSTSIVPLMLAMKDIKMATSISGITDKLIADGSKAVSAMSEMTQLTRDRVSRVQISMYNPFDTELTIMHISANNTWDGSFFGAINEDVLITIPPKSIKLSPVVSLVSPKGFSFLTTVLKLLAAYPSLAVGTPNTVPFDISSVITAKIGGESGYMANVLYKQLAVPISVQVVSSWDNAPAPASEVPAPAPVPSTQPTASPTLSPNPSPAPTTPTPSPAPVIPSPPAEVVPPTTTGPTVTPVAVTKRQDLFFANEQEELAYFIAEVTKIANSVGGAPVF